MWLPGTPITLTEARQQLTSTVGLVKAIKFMQDPSNTQPIYWGDSTLDQTAGPKAGVSGIVPNPTTEIPAPQETIYETDAPNGLNANLVYVSAVGGTLLWSYLIQ